jgi:hypothetical protein
LGFYEGDPEYEEDKGHIGMFLRNAVIYGIGMVEHYQTEENIPVAPITLGTRVNDFSVRLTPSLTDDNILGLTQTLLPASDIAIYGWSDVSTGIDFSYWLFVADTNNRLVWIAEGGVTHDPMALTPQNKITDPQIFSPIRAFELSDLAVLVGE